MYNLQYYSQWHLFVDVAVSLVFLWVSYHQFNVAIEADRLRKHFYMTFLIPLGLWAAPAFQNELPSDWLIWLNALFFASLPMSSFYFTVGAALLFKSLRSKKSHFWRLFYATFLTSLPALGFLMFIFRSQVAFLPQEFERLRQELEESQSQPRQRSK